MDTSGLRDLLGGRDFRHLFGDAPPRAGKISLLIYAAGMVVALAEPRAAFAMYALVALIWFVPDRRIERALRD